MIDKIRKSADLVENELKMSDRARGDDKYLMLRIWHRQGLVLTEEQRNTFLSKKIATPESITRARRKLQENGDLRPNEALYQARMDLEKQTRREISL